ncbi:MAG TPA: NAD-dependent epimerase/dehydratase family protein [Polyangiaceae bacterium]|jgi:UDP-glucose 4-epimerase|nr:NAD-dependent epimerase/dehydratase family protein [Polyangiaceae bacterium]
MKSFVVGGAGFIGSHLVDRLVERGPVTVYDDLSVGTRARLGDHLEEGRVTLVEASALELEPLAGAMHKHDVVFHLSANPEARWGLDNTRLDLDQGTVVTYNVLEAMRRNDVAKLVFSSSGTVYGDTRRTCREDDLGPLPISLYGASKLASEAMISAFVECFGLRAWIFRFGNVIGPRATHGCALDFMRKLASTKTELEVLGDGKQAKPYLHVRDCVDGMLFGLDHASERVNILNLTPADVTAVSRIAKLCLAASPYPNARIRYTGGDRGWPGDVPRSRMAPGKMAELGWTVEHTSDEAVALAVTEIADEVFRT